MIYVCLERSIAFGSGFSIHTIEYQMNASISICVCVCVRVAFYLFFVCLLSLSICGYPIVPRSEFRFHL